jgi:hypothetical protein
MAKRTNYVITAVLLVYFVFTSGLVYEVTGSEVTDRMVVPYSIPLSGERTGLVGVFIEDDLRCAKWVSALGKSYPVVCDGNVALLLRSYEFAMVEQIVYFDGAYNNERHYLFFSTWNVETNKMVVSATSAGLRGVDKMPVIDFNLYKEVYRSGKSVIYERVL